MTMETERLPDYGDEPEDDRTWNANVLGADATIQITRYDESELPEALLTVRCKDQDLTAEQFRSLAAAAMRAALSIETGKRHRMLHVEDTAEWGT